METKTLPPNPNLDKCECNHYRYRHWGEKGKGKCFESVYSAGFYETTSEHKCECKKFVLKEKDKGIKIIEDNS